MTAFSAFGGILYGYDTGIINGVIAMNDWTHTFGHPMPTAADPTAWGVTSSTQSLVVSVLSAGTFFGALLGAPLGGMYDFSIKQYTTTDYFRHFRQKMGEHQSQIVQFGLAPDHCARVLFSRASCSP